MPGIAWTLLLAMSQDRPLEERVLQELVGAKSALYVDNPPPHLGPLFQIGDAAIPVILRHASDDELTHDAACKTLYFWTCVRLDLPKAARDWIVAEFKRGRGGGHLVGAIGRLGLEEQIPRLEELAKGAEDRSACVAVQSLAAMGSAAARKALERLKGACASKAAEGQCALLLEKLYAAFDGPGGEDRLLRSIETAEELEPLKYSLVGGWLDLPALLLRRLVFPGRKDLLPRLQEMAGRVALHEKDVLHYDKASGRLIGLHLSIHLLGGKLEAPSLEELRKRGAIERP